MYGALRNSLDVLPDADDFFPFNRVADFEGMSDRVVADRLLGISLIHHAGSTITTPVIVRQKHGPKQKSEN